MSSNRIALAIVCAAFACAPSLAADVPIEVKSEFRQNVVKRDRLVRQLASIDSKAADAVVAGKAPVALHAQQTELQDKIEVHYAARVLLTCVANVCLGVVNVLLTP